MPVRVVKELPESGRGKYERPPRPEHVKLVKALQRKPYTWMSVREFQNPSAASRFARQVRDNEFIAFKGGQYEARSIKSVVYARYMGEQ